MDQNDFHPMPYRQIKAGPLTLRVKINGHVEVDYDASGGPLWCHELTWIAEAANEFIDDYNASKN